MRKNGFTLVEVLAVIFILGIIALITFPRVADTLRNAKRNSNMASTGMFVDALRTYAIDKKATLTPFEGCYMIFDIGENTCSDLEYSGEIPSSGFLTVDSDGVVNGYVYYDERFGVYNNDVTLGISVGDKNIFMYSGREQVFRVPADGYYKLEVWGAQGGYKTNTTHSNDYGGYGGYSVGIILLEKNSNLYVNVGGKGSDGTKNVNSTTGGLMGGTGGYNGGGDAGSGISNNTTKYSAGGGGGGATHVSMKTGLLSALKSSKNNILIVAGGGGGSSYFSTPGSGGGYIGANSVAGTAGNSTSGGTSTGGSQSSGYMFGKGQNGRNGTLTDFGAEGNGGGGGGFYGGYSSQTTGTRTDDSGAGGSGYIGNTLLSDKAMFCYGCSESNTAATKTVSTTGSSDLRDTTNCPSGFSENPVSKCAKIGNGYAIITYLGETL